ncbi:Protein O-mannosyltransferase 1 [Amphibalanus amphitrite]|uniref:dolichyl-phosphate-mannose--protein mannosyltransferase n=1 Tax=Amphibalanus amphitrite TaxID=1232801 RepID=A0A6A4WJX6_AMPAM|nr:Protein O-mannosyltransferase 1 [Amphibalanus amphitrite]
MHQHDQAPSGDQQRPAPTPRGRRLDVVAVLLLLAGLGTRLYQIDQPRGIVFDELHYGKYVALYMKQMFFFDSQPPLGKQLLAIPAYLAGFDGNFTFDRIGTPYPDTVPIELLRTAPAVAGALLLPVTYWLLLELGVSRGAATLAGVLILLENSLLTQSRFMFLEPFLMLFAALGVLCLARFRRCGERPFSASWLGWLVAGFAFLGAAVSVRYAGFLSLVLGWGLVAHDFWTLVPRPDVSGGQLAAHLVTRSALAVAVPAAVYLGSFYCHLAVLQRAGGGYDRVMSSAFQASLEDGLATLIKNQPVAVGHGSQVTLRHAVGRPCWLHSHGKPYPDEFDIERNSSRQQQVSCYSGKDANNWWIVKDPAKSHTRLVPPFRPFRDGDVVQLVHGITGNHLITSDGYRPPMSESADYEEVSCYTGTNTSIPKQDLWKVMIVNKKDTDGAWHAITSEVRFINQGNLNMALKFSGRRLPEWGNGQQEVVGDALADQEHTVWNVEEHRYLTMESNSDDERQLEVVSSDLIPMTEMQLSFWRKFAELQLKMLFNSQETVHGHTYATDPLEWLSLRRGVAYWISPDSNAQVHLVGNAAVWAASSAALLVYSALATLYLLRRKRACFDIPDAEWSKMCTVCRTVLGGFACHYLPYFVIDHTFFLHHYLPAYVFAVMLAACTVDHLNFVASHLGWRPLRLLLALAVLLWVAACGYTFVVFSSVSYGTTPLTPQQIKDMTWRDSWDFIVHKH